MRADTKKRKNATQMLRATQEQEWWADQVVHVMLEGKRALDAAMLDVGRLVAETLMYMEREERSGPDYHPVLPPSSVATPCLNANVSWPACVGERH